MHAFRNQSTPYTTRQANRLDVGIVWLRSKALDFGQFDGARSSRADGLTLKLDGLSLLLGFSAALGV